MSALPARLGIVAGGGKLPAKLLEFCDARKIQTFIIGFENHTDLNLLDARSYALVRLGAGGAMVRMFKEKGFKDLVVIGSVKRPGLWELRPDLYTMNFFRKLGFKAMGDDGLLQAIHAQLNEEGFKLHGIHEIMPDFLMPDGLLGSVAPTKAQLDDVALGFVASKDLGAKDLGQSVVVKEGQVIGTEDSKGTNALIKRSKGGILVKTCKPQQDRKLDLPTIGVDTIRLCAAQGFSGIAAEAGASMIVDKAECIAAADKAGLFLMGVTP